MEFIQEQGFDVREGQEHAFLRWLEANEAAIAAAGPDGIEYLRTYVAIYSDDRTGGAYRSLTRYDSYGAQDRFAAEAGGDTPLARLLREYSAFIDMSNSGNGSNQLLKRATDVTLFFVEE